MLKTCAAFTLLLLVAITRADEFDTWFGASPDKKLLAVERRIPDPDTPSQSICRHIGMSAPTEST